MPDFVITTAFKGKDAGVSSSLKRMSSNADRFGNTAKRSFGRASSSALSFKKLVSGILTAGIIRRGVGLLTQSVRELSEEVVSFDDAITAASAKFGNFDRGNKIFKDLQKTARGVGATTEFTGTQAAEGLRFLAKAGNTAEFSMKALRGFVDLATASEMEFSRAADIATDVMGAFGLAVDDPVKKLANLNRVNDVLSTAVNMSNITLEDLFETIKGAGPIARTAGIDIEKFSAIAAFIGGAGVKGSLGATALKNAITNLAAPGKQAKKIFRDLKIEFMDAEKNLRDPILIFEELRKKMIGMGTAQKTATLETIFGKRAIAGAAVSIEGGVKALGEFEKKLKDSEGASKKLALFMRTSLGNRLAELKSAAIEVGFRFVDAFEKKMPGAIDGVIKAVRGFDVANAIEQIKAFAHFVKDVWQGIKDAKPFILGLVAAFVTLKTILAGIAAAKFVAGIASVAALANPIGAVVLAVGALVTAGVAVWENWDDLRQAFGWLWDDVKVGLDEAWTWFVGFLDNPFFHAIRTIFMPLQEIPFLIIKFWEPLTTFFSRLFDGIVELVMTHGTDKLKALFSDTIDWIKRKIDDLLGWLKDVFSMIGNIGSAIGGTIVQAGKALGKVGAEAGAGVGKALLQTGKNLFKTPEVGTLGGAPERTPPNREAPNEAAVEGAAGFLEGRITLAGAPEGSVFDMQSVGGAPPIQTEMEALNP